MLRFKQFLIEYSLILEDKATSFANRYLKIHADNPLVKNDPTKAAELFKQAMAYTQGSDESDFLTKQFLDGKLKPVEDDASIRDVLGKWRKATQRKLTKGKTLSSFNYDTVQDFFNQYPELNVSKASAKTSTFFDPYKIGDVELPGDVKVFDATGNLKKINKGERIQAYRLPPGARTEEIENFQKALKKVCPPGSTWCVLNDPEYLRRYSRNRGFLFYSDQSGTPIFGHGYGDRGIVNTKNAIINSELQKHITKSTNPLLTDPKSKLIHKYEAQIDYTPDEMQELLRDQDTEVKKMVLGANRDGYWRYRDPTLSPDEYSKQTGMQHLPDEILDRIAAHTTDEGLIRSFIQSPYVREKDLKQFLGSTRPLIRSHAIKYAMGYGPEGSRSWSTPKDNEMLPDIIDDETFEKLRNDSDPGVKHALLDREFRYMDRPDRLDTFLQSRDNEFTLSIPEYNEGHWQKLVKASTDPKATETRRKIFSSLMPLKTGQNSGKDSKLIGEILKIDPDPQLIRSGMEKLLYSQRSQEAKSDILRLVSKNKNIDFIKEFADDLASLSLPARKRFWDSDMAENRFSWGDYTRVEELALEKIAKRQAEERQRRVTPSVVETQTEVPKMSGKDVAGKVATTLIDPTQPVVDATVAQAKKAAPKLGNIDILPPSRSRIPAPRPVATSIGYGLGGLAGGLVGEYLVKPAAEKAGVFNSVEKGTRETLSAMPPWAANIADVGLGVAQTVLDPISAIAPLLQAGIDANAKREVDSAIKAGSPSQVRFRGPKF